MATVQDLVRRNRSYRRFDNSFTLNDAALHQLVDLGRLSPNGGNMQPLRFAVSSGAKNAAIYACLGWAGYLPKWPGPIEAERPTGYIIILCDSALSKTPAEDAGIAAQSIMLGAVEMGLGGCIFKNINHGKLKEALALPDNLDIAMVLAIGKPVECVVMDDVGTDGDIKYWREDNGVHHVPKRALADVLVSIE